VSETEDRKRFVDCALSWLGTPYHHMASLKGIGVDCATLLVCSAKEAGLIPQNFSAGNYTPQWNLNRTAQTYLATIGKVCVEVPPPPRSGDIVVFKFGRVFAHGGIVIEWPRFVHAYQGSAVQIDDAERNTMFAYVGEANGEPRPKMFVSLWPR
jgi:cell wall-associated NlpC family hydrolase